MTHGHNIYAKASDMAKATMCENPQSYHALLHWKFILQCCAKCPCVNLPDQKTDDQYSETIPSKNITFLSNCALYNTWKASVK